MAHGSGKGFIRWGGAPLPRAWGGGSHATGEVERRVRPRLADRRRRGQVRGECHTRFWGKTECIAYVVQDLFSTHILMSQVHYQKIIQ
jgi:hypothetical protein